MRIPQPNGTKGSLFWIQVLINEYPKVLYKAVVEQTHIHDHHIHWLSPLKVDQFAEYRDDSFIETLGLGQFKEQLKEFWPRNGPQWDALGRCSEKGPYFLVEAKANAPEILSSSKAKSEKSIELIRRRLSETAQAFGCTPNEHWTKSYYQYANRLAQLHFLRSICCVDAYLLLIYFVDDTTHIPTSQPEWVKALELQKHLMNLDSHRMMKRVAEVFIDVGGLT